MPTWPPINSTATLDQHAKEHSAYIDVNAHFGTNAAAIQAAIDAAFAAGGGTVFCAKRNWGTGTVTVKAGVRLVSDQVIQGTGFPAVVLADDSSYHEFYNGQMYVAANCNFGFHIANYRTGGNAFAAYRVGKGSPAVYIESTDINMGDQAGHVDAGLRMERRNTGPPAGQDRGIDIESYYSGATNVGPSLRIHANNAGENPSVLLENTHQASPNGPYTGMLVIDNQQASATNNAGVETRQYQDSIDGFLVRDGQRSNVKSVRVFKDSAGGKVQVNNASGTLKIELDGSGIASFANKIYPGTAAAAFQSTAGIYGGSGVPSNANGANGDYYFRSDTPGTANQRIYVKSAGAWVGIV